MNILVSFLVLGLCYQASAQDFDREFLLRQLNNLERKSSNDVLSRQSSTSPQMETYEKNGYNCTQKLINTQKTEYDRGMECNHTVTKKCHLTYITDYTSSADKKCETNYRKSCHIVFRPQSHQEKVKICHTPNERICDDEETGEEICSTQYETVCETTFKEYELKEDEPVCKMVEKKRCENVQVEVFNLPKREGEESTSPTVVKQRCENWPVQECTLISKNVKKIHPETSCKKIAKNVCMPNTCKLVAGKEICNEETRTLVQNIPEEECNLEPHENCQSEPSLVPRLVPMKNCVDVPKEVCVNTRTNPQQVNVPFYKEWCFDPKDLDNAQSD
ncbi:unnamed protein product [Lepeophtheirus salmonis]|uniref:(salmon louse) hypothetical protein n=1 Tax=Lepeophtheirus salmonis TaxID=72036 RepID=A0A7R8D3K6_LEPSM|nr:unnamed protein product [Lepeophtheirus salmonis]CAF2984380.1 unnamed protein product [Lepeophtheirus salmonis]